MKWLLGEIARLRRAMRRQPPALMANEIMAPHASSPGLQQRDADALRDIVGCFGRPPRACRAHPAGRRRRASPSTALQLIGQRATPGPDAGEPRPSGQIFRPGANTGVDFAFSSRTSIDSFVTFDIDGRSITAGSAPGKPTSTRVASAVARKRAGGRVAVENTMVGPAMQVRV